MRVLLIGNYPPDGQQSMRRFAALLHRGLTARGHHVELLAPPVAAGALSPGAAGLGKLLGYCDKFAVFPPRLRAAAARAEVVHICDHSNAMYTAQLAGRPHLVTCHDLLAVRSARGEIPENPVRWSGRRLQAWIASGLVRAQRIACISSATRDDLERVLRVPRARLSLVPNGLQHPFRALDADERQARLGGVGVDGAWPYLLHVGSNAWYKNRAGVLAIAGEVVRTGRIPGLRLVLAGQRLDGALRDRVASCGLAGRVVELGPVDDDQLEALYGGALGLLFPSLAEGFGWPVIEAQAAGCPVFTSARAPLTEVGGDAAVYLDPLSPAAAAQAVLDGLAGADGIRERGFANAARFSAGSMLEAYERIYRELLE